MFIPTDGYKPISIPVAAKMVREITGRRSATIRRAKYNDKAKMLWYVDGNLVYWLLDCSTGMQRHRTPSHDDTWSEWELCNEVTTRSQQDHNKGEA